MPDWRHIVRARLRESGVDPDADRSLVDELAQHLEDRYRTTIAAGATEDAAYGAAIAELDGSDRLAAEVAARREAAPVTPGGPAARPFAGLWQDVKYAARTLRRSPGFTIAAVVTVALSTGPTMAALGVVNWVFFRPIPGVHDPDRLAVVRFATWRDAGSYSPSWVAYQHLEAMRSGSTAIAGMAGHQPGSVNLSIDDAAPRIERARFVTANYFDVLGTGMSEGRGFHPDEDRDPGGTTVVVLGRVLADALFGDRPAVGREIRINGHPFTVVGVARPGFEGTDLGERTMLWLPARATPRVNHAPRDRWAYGPDRGPFYEFIVRLTSDATFAHAEAELQSAALALFRQGTPETSKYETVQPRVVPGLDSTSRGAMRPFATQILALAAVLVLLGTANLANLFLFRGARRTHEAALRRSLGASAGRLVQLHVVEAVVVSGAGAVLGLGIAAAVDAALDGTIVRGIGALDVEIDWRLVSMAACLAVAVGVLLGLAPARLAGRGDLAGSIAVGGRTSARPGGRLRTGLAAVQLALSLTLLIGGLLFVQTLRNLGHVDLGFDARRVSTFSFALRGQGYTPPRTTEFYRRLIAQLDAEPGIDAVSAATGMPLASRSYMRVLPPDVAALQGRTNRELFDLGLRVLTEHVTPGYFRSVGMELVSGRTFTEREAYTSGIEPGVVISASLAERLFGTTQAVGRPVSFPGQGGQPRHDAPVIAVVNDVRWLGPRQPPEFVVYLPFGEVTSLNHFVLVRSGRSEAEIARIVQGAAASIDPVVPVGWDRSMTDLFHQYVAEERMLAAVLGVLAALGFLLAGVGVYGLVSQGVVERVREFGIRMAIGAGRAAIARLVLRQALVIAAIGVPLGLLLAGLGSQVVESQLFGVAPLAPAIYAVAIGVLLVAVCLAVVPPAVRAVRVNPVEVMRME